MLGKIHFCSLDLVLRPTPKKQDCVNIFNFVNFFELRLLLSYIAILEYESSLNSNEISKARLEDLARFSVLCMDFAKWLFSNSGTVTKFRKNTVGAWILYIQNQNTVSNQETIQLSKIWTCSVFEPPLYEHTYG